MRSGDMGRGVKPLIQRNHSKLRVGLLTGVFVATGIAVSFLSAKPVKATQSKPGQEKLAANVGSFNAQTFIENKGQWGAEPLFYGAGRGLDVWMNKRGLVYDFYTKTKFELDKKTGLPKLGGTKRSGQVISMEFMNSRPQAQGRGVERQDGAVNYLFGNQSYKNVGRYNEAFLDGLYNGVDMRLYRENGAPRFDFIVAPGADPGQIQFVYRGANSVRNGNDGTIKLGTRFGDVAIADLKAYQDGTDGRTPVSAKFVVGNDGIVRFGLGNYDRTRELVIDPIVWSTLYGAFGGNDIGRDIYVDNLNFSYVTGQTDGVFYPTTNGAYDNTVVGTDVFVTKMKKDGTGIVFSTVAGGAPILDPPVDGNDIALGIAVDSQGRPCITGVTNTISDIPSLQFPTTDGAPQRSWGGGVDLFGVPLYDAFIARFSADGTELEYGTLLGGNGNLGFLEGNDIAYGIGVDGADNIYVAGQAESLDFPTTNDVFQPVPQGGRDGFVCKISESLEWSYCTFIGGSASDTLTGIAVDTAGFAHLVGTTNSTDYPTTSGAFDRTVQNTDALVTKLDPTGNILDFSTVIGGSANEGAAGIAIDSDGNSYICGATNSVDFPRTPGCYDNVYNPDFENYVTKISLDGASLRFSTLMNGGGTQTSIAVDDQGYAHITGYVLFQSIPAINADDATYNGPNDPLRIGDAYLQALNEAGSDLVYSSYIGGSEDELSFGIAIDRSRNAYITGASNSWNGATAPYPTTPGVFKTAMSLDTLAPPPLWDGIMVKAKVRAAPILQEFSIAQVQLAGTERTTATITLSAPASPGGAVIAITTDNPAVAMPDDNGNLLETIVIPEGQTTATFPIVTFDVAQTYTVNFTAELEGDERAASVTVAPWLTNLSLSPNSIVGGNKVTGRVSLYRPAPTSGLSVSITSSQPDLAFAVDSADQPISTIAVPTGATSSTFSIKTRGVDVTTNISILARITTPNLVSVRSQPMTIRPAKLKSLSFNPTNVNGGQFSTGTLLLDGEAGTSLIRFDMTLGSGTANVSVPAVTAIGARQTSGTFRVTTNYVAANAFRTVIATRRGDTSQVKQAAIFVDAIDMADLVLGGTSVQGGTNVNGFLQLTRPASSGGFTFTVTSSNTTVAPILGSPTRTVPAGAVTSPNFVIATKVTNSTQTVTITASKTGYVSKTRNLTVRAVTFALTADATAVVGGEQNVNFTLTLNEAPTTSILINLSSSNPTAMAVPASVRISNPNRTATFLGTTSEVNTPVNVTVTASSAAVPTNLVATRTVTVNPPPPRLISITFTPNNVVGGNTSLGRVILERPAPAGGVIVTLTKDSGTGAPFCSVPTTVTIPAGARNVAFNVTTTLPSRTVACTITASTGVNAPTVSGVLTIRRS